MKHVYPVIHHLDWQTTQVEAAIAFKHGADGVFLISHRGDDTSLLGIAHDMKRQYSDKKIGLNLLGFACHKAYHLCTGIEIDMLWTDAPGINSKGYHGYGIRLQEVFGDDQKKVQVFASVAFKYQPVDPDPALAAKHAQALDYVATTSGPGTGQAPDLEKIKVMSEAVHGNLAVASGMTPDNVSLFLPYVDYFLVSTGISKDEYRLDEDKLKRFVEVVHNKGS